MAAGEDTNRLEELFARAVDLPRDERAAFLERECGADAELRARLDALLGQDERGTRGVLARQMFAGDPPPEERVDRYKLIEKLGEGGMGTVYLAEQEEPVRRKVALKTIRIGAGSADVLARFEGERQALALMNHPGIAKIYDGGVAASGLPYFVMEYCPGLPITEHCDRFKLSIEERIHLFRRVCDAVQHAHQKGIIHRDLKPGNILVTERDNQAVPKVIDFGIARAISGSLRKEQRELTGTGVIGSHLYMSPEQADPTGDDIDTRTDIYSLGVILYELLAGVTPFQHEHLEEFGFAVLRDIDPPRPSKRLALQGDEAEGIAARRRTTERSLTRTLRGDLDWITMKCLEKDRVRRYASASELAGDLIRHLENEPVLAGPPTTSYRARKFVRRHRISVAGSAALLLSLIAGIVGTTVEKRRAQAATILANYEVKKSNAVLELFWYGLVHGHASMTPDHQSKSVLALFQESPDDFQELLNRSPGAEAAVRTSLGRAFLFLGEDRAALDQLRLARKIQASDPGKQPIDVFVTVTGLLQATRRVEGLAAADKYMQEALTLAREILAERVPELAGPVDALIDLALGRTDDVDDAEAFEHLDEIMQAFPESLHYGNESVVMGRLILEIGGALRLRGKDVGDAFFRELDAKARELLDEEDIKFQSFLWVLATVQLMPEGQEHFEEALEYATELSRLSRGSLPPEHWLRPEASRIEGVAHYGLGNYKPAEVALRDAWETLDPVDPKNDRQRQTAMSARALHVRTLVRLDRRDEARRAFVELERVLEEPLTPSTRSTIATAQEELEE